MALQALYWFRSMLPLTCLVQCSQHLLWARKKDLTRGRCQISILSALPSYVPPTTPLPHAYTDKRDIIFCFCLWLFSAIYKNYHALVS
jgi:hypothetical protein